MARDAMRLWFSNDDVKLTLRRHLDRVARAEMDDDVIAATSHGWDDYGPCEGWVMCGCWDCNAAEDDIDRAMGLYPGTLVEVPGPWPLKHRMSF